MRRTEEKKSGCLLYTGSKMERPRSSHYWFPKRRCKLWWSGNNSGTGGIGISVKEELCEKIVEVRRKSDRVMAMVMAFGEVVRVVCAYGPQSGRKIEEKHRFYDDLVSEWVFVVLVKWFWV